MKFKLGLIWRILIAIGLAIGLGLLLPMIHEGFAHWFVRLAATFNMLFGGFLNFVVPLIIIAFIAPSIAKLGAGSGNCLECLLLLRMDQQSSRDCLRILQQQIFYRTSLIQRRRRTLLKARVRRE